MSLQTQLLRGLIALPMLLLLALAGVAGPSDEMTAARTRHAAKAPAVAVATDGAVVVVNRELAAR